MSGEGMMLGHVDLVPDPHLDLAAAQRRPTIAGSIPVLPEAPRRPQSSVDYRASHSALLTSLYGEGRPELPSGRAGNPGPLLGHRTSSGARTGAIVVPTCRDFRRTDPGLRFAAGLAQAHGCALVVICSRQARTAEFPEDLRQALGADLVLLDLADVHPSWIPPLQTNDDPLGSLYRSNDVGRKRNLGIMLAQRLGWQYLLFLDDDITPAESGPTLSPRHLSHAIRSMQQDECLNAVGWPLTGFDDNSVVGHARRRVGMPQDVFVSAGALMLRCSERTAFFPEGIYNEDWLLLIQSMGGSLCYQRSIAWGGWVHQQPYDAFRADRARSEEAGEILAEGLMNLLEDHGPGFAGLMSSGRYWKRVQAGRRSLLRRIVREVSGEQLAWIGKPPPRSDDPVVTCMNSALATHAEITPRRLVSYAQKWWSDGEAWRDCLGLLDRESADLVPEHAIGLRLSRARAPWPTGPVLSAWPSVPGQSQATPG